MGLSALQMGYLVLIGIGGGFVLRVSGFGLAIFAMLFFPHLFGSTAVSAAVSCIWSCVTAVYNVIRCRRDANLRLIVPLICAAAVSIPPAVRLSVLVPKETMTAVLGIVLIVLSIYFLAFRRRIRMRASVRNGILAGALGGLLNGLFSTGGPPVVLYLADATNDKDEYFASVQLYFALTNIYATVMRAVNGILTKQVLLWAAVGLIGCMLGNALGRLVFQRLDTERVKWIIYVGMIISGISMIF